MALRGYTSMDTALITVDTDRYRRIEYALLVVALITATISTYMLFFANATISIQSGAGDQALAVIDNVREEVRRKPQNLPAWSSVVAKDAIHSKDQIFTGENSSAKLIFNDRTEFDLGQNTLIVIERNEKESVLNLLRGSLHIKGSVNTNDNLKIKSGKTIASVSGSNTRARLSKNDAGEVDIAVAEGQMQLASQNRQIPISQGQAATLSNSGYVGKIETLPLTLARPDFGASLLISPNNPTVELFWNYSGEANYVVELSHHSGFDEIISSQKTAMKSASISIPKEGDWYWRVRNTDTKTGAVATSMSSLLRVRYESVPVPLEPRPNAMVAKEDNGAVVFDWSDKLESTTYRFEISSDDSFSKVIKTIDSAQPPLTVTGVPEGQLYWRVRSTALNRPEALWSKPAAFQILVPSKMPAAPAPEDLEAPELEDTYQIKIPKSGAIVPKRKKSFWSYLSLIDTAYADAAKASDIRWRAVKGAAKYFVEVSLTEDFATRVIEKEVERPELEVNTLNPGEYFLRVTSVDVTGRKGKTSKPSRIIVKAPEIVAPPKPVIVEKPKIEKPLPPAIVAAPMIKAPPVAAPRFSHRIEVQTGAGPKHINYKTSAALPLTKITVVTPNNMFLSTEFNLNRKWSTKLAYERAATRILDTDESGKKDSSQGGVKLVFQDIALLQIYKPQDSRWQWSAGLEHTKQPLLHTSYLLTIAAAHIDMASVLLAAQYERQLSERNTLIAVGGLHLGAYADDADLESAYAVESTVALRRATGNMRLFYGASWQAKYEAYKFKYIGAPSATDAFVQSICMNVGFKL